MTETRPVQSTQPSTDANAHAPDRRHLQADTLARFRQALSAPTSERGADRTSANVQTESRDLNPRKRANAEDQSTHATALSNAERGDAKTPMTSDGERRDVNSSAPAMPATVASLYYSLPVTQSIPELSTATSNVETVRLIEQATSVLMERSSRADASRFIVSLDHAIVGGASAEFVRDGAFLHVRLLARNDAAYRSMWANRVELEERLAASTGLVTRVEISEGYGDGRSA